MPGGVAQPAWRDRHQQLVHVRGGMVAVPTSWCITPSSPSTLIVPSLGVQIAGDQLEQRRLADTVGADDRHAIAVADPESDVAEQFVATRQLPGELADGDRTHER
jgi:hypothetical protein